jgi:uncharacterized Zn finger protein
VHLELTSLLALADERVLTQGKERFMSGAVIEAARSRGRIQARVAGSAPFPYRVEINLTRGEWRCSCPYAWGPVCKHVAAVAFAALEAPEIFIRRKLGRSVPLNMQPLRELSDDELLRFLWQLSEERPELLHEFAYNLLQRYE